MQDTIQDLRKGKIQLSDYDYQSDIANRILLSELSSEALEVLEEILYSPITFSVESLCDNLNYDVTEIHSILSQLLPTELFTLKGTLITVDKEKRKYFETHIEKFDEDFQPNMDFFQNILRHIPIQVLPTWYQIPRSSDNIFLSLIEKCLQTPQIFQRYMSEFISTDDILSQIIKDVYDSEELHLFSSKIQEKYQLSKEKYQEIALFLELNLFCITSYKKVDGQFLEILSPFQEWRRYQETLKASKPNEIPSQNNIEIYRENEFAFISDMTQILELCKKNSIEVNFDPTSDHWALSDGGLEFLSTAIPPPKDSKIYFNKVINKLIILGLALIEEKSLRPTDLSYEWSSTPIKKRAHITFKHPHNFLAIEKNSQLSSQRAVLEIEKSITTVANLNWVTFDDFLKGSIITLRDCDKITLVRSGRQWIYKFPEYNVEATDFIKFVVMEWLFESGVVQIGTYNGAPCFRVTSLGRSLFQ